MQDIKNLINNWSDKSDIIIQNNKDFYAPSSFWKLSKKEIKSQTNGCGPEGWGWLVPDCFHPYFFCISNICTIHDYMYNKGKNLKDKRIADLIFRKNFEIKLSKGKKWKWLKILRKRRFQVYFKVVKNKSFDLYCDMDSKSC
ncbi:MAG: Unknown protein [uncultured Campylobacterales bacterium]|uniref:DUF1353 domain-containing protein n=1 Tax=uncultured Campylobacterales bacterium TaxID=352960 RepID=A0A6S6SAJ0_9BACT|nr:MAG: Unknown protein [uncultured Campylobacterales bacterium]